MAERPLREHFQRSEDGLTLVIRRARSVHELASFRGNQQHMAMGLEVEMMRKAIQAQLPPDFFKDDGAEEYIVYELRIERRPAKGRTKA